MKDLSLDIKKRVAFIKRQLKKSNTSGVVFGNSGGKDAVLVGALCKMATDNTTGVIMPCKTGRGFNEDRKDALLAADFFKFKSMFVDLSKTKDSLEESLKDSLTITDTASSNINPRLRMSALYSIAQSLNCLVAGTGNKSEIFIGYFTKWGDGAYDFNPIADLTASDVKKYLKYLNAPPIFYTKPPSAGLFEGQTDETDLGMTYEEIDNYLTFGKATKEIEQKINTMHEKTVHKRKLPSKFKK